MTEPKDLQNIERSAFRSAYQDGLYDICYGIFLMAWAVVPALKDAGIPKYLTILPFLVIPAIILFAGKKYITMPRFGSAKFGPQRLGRAVKMMGAGAIGLVLTYAAVILIAVWGLETLAYKNTGDFTLPIFESVGVLVIVSLLAYFSDFRRLYLYGVFFAGGIPLSEILYNYVGEPADALIAFGIPALGVIVVGIAMFVRFIRKYPHPSEIPDAI